MDIRSEGRYSEHGSALKNNEAVWFAPDQSYRNKGAAMVNFFGIPLPAPGHFTAGAHIGRRRNDLFWGAAAR